MNPILTAAFYGLAKGVLTRPNAADRAVRRRSMTTAPVMEEVMYRGIPAAFGVFNPTLSAVAFAADHVVREKHSIPSGLIRFADVCFGGLVYGAAHKAYGLFGAIVAHFAHNAALAAVHGYKERK